MEQDCIADLYQYLGLSAGAEFSLEDVSLLFSKVCHIPANTCEAHAAMKKIAGGDSSWSCTGENVLGVLLEIEREKERKEMLYWDFQLLNAGNLHHMTDDLHQSKDHDYFINRYTSESRSLQPCTVETDNLKMGGLVEKQELCNRVRRVRRLKKAARQCWVRLASEGVQSILPSPSQGQRLGIRGQAWGCVSLSDILLLVEVKYDVVTHLLYSEMLQEHHTESVWETLLPWRQHKEVEVLEDLAEEALECVDMLRLAMLPGAFRMYKACLDASLRNCPELREQSWSAVSFLNELHTFRQQEQNTLAALGQRLQGESLRLLCLYIWFATLRAQREKMSYGALLAARQSWETWPRVVSPCRIEQAALWLHGEEEEVEEEKEDFKTLQQKAALQLLVLSQEQERKHLVKLVHGVSLEDLEGSSCTMPSNDDGEQAALKAGCIERLREINTRLQTQHGSLTPTNSHTVLQEEWSQLQLEDGALLLLTHLMELQEVQASALLEALVDRNAQHIETLRDKYEDEIKARRFTSLLHLLTSDNPQTLGSILIPNLTENSNNEPIQPQTENIIGGSAEATTAESIEGASIETNEGQTANGPDRQDVCSGCGAVIEDLPYLEILCESDEHGDVHQGLSAEGGATEEEEGSATKSPQSYQKQGSLIALAWSKRLETAEGGKDQRQDVESMRTQVQATQSEETGQNRDGEEVDIMLSQCSSSGHHKAPSADQQCSPVEQLILNMRPVDDQPNEKEATSQNGQQTLAMVAENLQAIQQHLMADSSEHADDLCSETTNHTVNAGKGMTEVEMCPTEAESEVWERGPELSHYEDLTHCQESPVDCSLSKSAAKRESTPMEREPVSAMERERTMRSLVDMQKKVEQRQQRDRERQLLRVQERLSIIQNRKAEEDLLGLKNTDRLRHLTQDLPLEDKSQQKTVVRERLEQLRRERSYIMQSRRDRNTAGFKELLAPVALHSNVTDKGSD